ncbi:NAD-dependent epimerase/dehydratase family protein [Mucilaginibacter paludis]|uniref:Semialdehyde dehydrogenase NAD-binding n=1 Tax=Mucilaginibacter paludis DSM 18603 TaxID=714943 RepID=H1YG69_9SPHI|nr:NAD(P)H-binding protein [Mucilaginibacter paludis]EHQ27333.1 Semialdehyde dehydrogenase NAD - binding [Mucilaginibacter paludis DSM 18603]
MLKKAVIVGASGLIGGELLNILLQNTDYQEVISISRKELPINHTKLVQLVISFDELDKWSASINGHVLFCCLGTTAKKTPDLIEYRKIDHDHPVKLAQLAHLNGIKQYHLVSALGANANSAGFYLKTKGETERDIEKIPFKTVQIYQPSLLTGNRQEKRLMERIAIAAMKVIDPLLIGGLSKYRSIPAITVARAMFKQSLKNEVGIFIHPSDKIKQLA